MNPYIKGLIAGFVATIVLSALMMVKEMMGMLPQLNVIVMLSNMLGSPETPIVGWLAHFAIGTVAWGLLFVALAGSLPGAAYWQKGAVFATGAWLLMMIVVMPMAGAGLFGLGIGIMAPVMTLVLHWIFGAVLGAVYVALGSQQAGGGQSASGSSRETGSESGKGSAAGSSASSGE